MPKPSTETPFRENSEPKAKRPEVVFRLGAVSASVFAHEIESDGNSRILRSVSLQRRYRDGDEAKYASSFGLSELPQAIRVLELAAQYVEAREAQIVSAE